MQIVSSEPDTSGIRAALDDHVQGVALALAYLGDADLVGGEPDIRAELEGLTAAFDRACASAKVRQNDPTELKNAIANAVREVIQKADFIHGLSETLFRGPDAHPLYGARVQLLDGLKRAAAELDLTTI